MYEEKLMGPDLKYQRNRMTQLSYMILDESNKVISIKNIFIKPCKNFPEKDPITKITRKFLEKYGVDLDQCLNEFKTDLSKCVILVAHNLQQDIHIMRYELRICKIDEKFLNQPIHYCTMNKTYNAINALTNENKPKRKQQSLSEVHNFLFKNLPNVSFAVNGRHNALFDVKTLTDCYLIMDSGKVLGPPLVGIAWDKFQQHLGSSVNEKTHARIL